MPIFDDDVPVPAADPAVPTPHGLITIAQAAALFHRTPRTLLNWRKRGWLQAVRVCGGLYFREADIEALRDSKAVSAAELDAAPSDATAPDTTALNAAPPDAPATVAAAPDSDALFPSHSKQF